MTVIKCQRKSGAYGEAWWCGGGAGGVESPGEQKISRRELDTMGKDNATARKENDKGNQHLQKNNYTPGRPCVQYLAYIKIRDSRQKRIFVLTYSHSSYIQIYFLLFYYVI